MLKMTIYVKENEIGPRDRFEYKGNKEVGRVLQLISESLLKNSNEYPKDTPMVTTWYGQILEKIEIVGE